VNNAVTSEMCGVLLSWLWGLFITTLTGRPASFKAARHHSRLSAGCNWSIWQVLLHSWPHKLLAR